MAGSFGKAFFATNSVGFPPESRGFTSHFDQFSVNLNQFQSVSVKFPKGPNQKENLLWEFQGATRLGATGLRGSEREICL